MDWNLEEAIAYWKKQGAPRDQGAVTNLLREIQQENGGGIPMASVYRAAEALEVKESLLLALIRRIPSLRLSNSHTLELCGGPNCGKHRALADYAEKHCGGSVTLKFVPCMRMCAKGPNLRFDGKLYNQADIQLLKDLLKNI